MKKYIAFIFIFLLLLSSLFLYLRQPVFEKGLHIEPIDKNVGKILSDEIPNMDVKYTYMDDLYNAYLEGENIVQIYGDFELEANKNTYYYPLFNSNVVIGINRKNYNGKINSWQDLLNSNAKVGIALNLEISIMAMSYALENDPGKTNESLKILRSIEKNKNLKVIDRRDVLNEVDSLDLIVLFDNQGKYLNSQGKNIEIITPKEGSIYLESGLLSEKDLNIEKDKLIKVFDENGYLPIGKEIENSKNIKDIDVQALDYLLITSKYYRRVLNQRLFGPSNGFELNMSYLLLTIVILFWGQYSYVRINDKNIRRDMTIISYLMAFWCIVRIMKYRSYDISSMHPYLWYLFYLGIIFVSLLSFWIALSVEKPLDEKILNPIKKISFTLAVLLFLSVITNNLHYKYFIFDRDIMGWEYSYGPSFILVIIWELMGIIITPSILLLKARRLPSKKALIGPIVLVALCILYQNNRAIIISSEVTFTACVIVMIAFELSMRSGLIPINKKYSSIFKASTIAMEIYDNKDEIKYKSSIDIQGDNIEYFVKPIQGGYVTWARSLEELDALDRTIIEKNRELFNNYEVTKNQYLIAEKLESLKVKSELIKKVESVISIELINASKGLEEALKKEGEEREIALSLISYEILRIKQKSNALMNSMISGKLNLEDIGLICKSLSKMAERFSTKTDLFIQGDCEFDFEEVIVIGDYFSEVLQNTFFKDISLLGSFKGNNKKFKLFLYTDLNEKLNENPFIVSDEVKNSANKEGFYLHYSQDEDGYRGFIEFEIGGK